MKITYGNNIEFKFKFLLWFAVLFVLASDPLFLELVFGELKRGNIPPFFPENFLAPLAVLLSFVFYNRFSPFMKKFFWAATIYLVFLVLESSLTYGSFFIYPHVFSKILFIYPVFFMYLFTLNNEDKVFGWISFFICLAFLVNLVLYKSYILSAASFMGTQRGFIASSAYLLLIPCLYFFNKYLQKSSLFYLFAFFVMVVFIVFLQHRSVWIATSAALFFNFLLVKKASFKPTFQSYISLVAIPFFLCLLLVTFILSSSPELSEKLFERANDIVNFKSEGTGNWRYQQFLAYWPYVIEHPIFGMHFKGFELPIQFYNPEVGVPIFNDGTGHHFHSLYLDKLFYLGLVGLAITLAPVFYLIYKLMIARKLSPVQLTLSCFAISGFFYGVSYWWPPFFYAFLGMAINLIDQEGRDEVTIEEVIQNDDTNNQYSSSYKNEYV